MSQDPRKTAAKPTGAKDKAEKPAGEPAKDLPVGQQEADKVKGGAVKFR